MCSAGVKVGNSLPGFSSRIRGVRIASTTTMLAVAPPGSKPSAKASVQASAAAFARGVGGVGVASASAPAWRRRGRSGRARWPRAGRGRRGWSCWTVRISSVCSRSQSSSGSSCSGCPPRQPPTRWTSPSTCPKRSTSAAHQPRDRVLVESGRPRARPSARPGARARPRARRRPPALRSAPATIAPAAASRAATERPEPTADPGDRDDPPLEVVLLVHARILHHPVTQSRGSGAKPPIWRRSTTCAAAAAKHVTNRAGAVIFRLPRRTAHDGQADIGEAAANAWPTRAGFGVWVPLGHSPDADLIAERDRRLLRIQVKTSTAMRKGRYEVALATKGGNRSQSGRVRTRSTPI